MKAPQISVGPKDPGSLARTATVRINGSRLETPDLALDVAYSAPVGPEVLSQAEFKGRTTLVEVYRTLTIDKVSECLGEDDRAEAARRKLDAELGSALRRAADVGGIPLLLLALTDNNRSPLNDVPDRRVMTFVMDLLWRPENRIIVPPLMGVLPKAPQYESVIREIAHREQTIQERWVMAAIPSTYRPLTEEIIAKYWKAGARAFALDMQGRGFSGNSSAVTLMQRVLGQHRRDSGEDFFLHAINAKEKVGMLATARTNCLLGSAFGFDSVGLNHIPPKGFASAGSPAEEIAKIGLFQASDYGYHSVRELRAMKGSSEKTEFDTYPFSTESLESLVRRANPGHARLVAKKHNLTKSLREAAQVRTSLSKGRFAEFIVAKSRVVDDYELAREVVHDVRRRTITLEQ
jgi:hypothetical protein